MLTIFMNLEKIKELRIIENEKNVEDCVKDGYDKVMILCIIIIGNESHRNVCYHIFIVNTT